ncbi:MAG TPA: Sec-independent protein translocase protein TatB, partial [Steroidobacteraceae bacterium]|nr:Sec-independent protein translocase protein TatB [Steroidobacteraceae bacterium]HQZ80219.1 Sec-independent protein translocase protein TatB [Steroidobacteraceae bacterium]
MFEVGFTELLLIFALALIVLGPEKLPRLASQVGRWLGRARAMARQFREQLEEETILEESKPRQPAAQPAPSPTAPPPVAEKYYQPEDDVARADVSHADA